MTLAIRPVTEVAPPGPVSGNKSCNPEDCSPVSTALTAKAIAGRAKITAGKIILEIVLSLFIGLGSGLELTGFKKLIETLKRNFFRSRV